MEWNKLSRQEKVKWLSQQLEDIKRAQAIIDRFEQLTKKWLDRAEKARKGK